MADKDIQLVRLDDEEVGDRVLSYIREQSLPEGTTPFYFVNDPAPDSVRYGGNVFFATQPFTLEEAHAEWGIENDENEDGD